MRLVHPGEILREDFFAPLGFSVSALSIALKRAGDRALHALKAVLVKSRLWRRFTSPPCVRRTRPFATLGICWRAQRASYEFNGVSSGRGSLHPILLKGTQAWMAAYIV